MVVIYPVEYKSKDCDIGFQFLTYENNEKSKFRQITKDNFDKDVKKEIETIKQTLEKNGFNVWYVSKLGPEFVPLETNGAKIVRMRVKGNTEYKSIHYGNVTETLNVINSILVDHNIFFEYWSGFFHIGPRYGEEDITEERNNFEMDPQTSILISKDDIVGPLL